MERGGTRLAFVGSTEIIRGTPWPSSHSCERANAIVMSWKDRVAETQAPVGSSLGTLA